MAGRRTSGMTAIAIFNFIFGAYWIFEGMRGVVVGHALLSRPLVTEEQASILMYQIGFSLPSLGGGILALVGGLGVFQLAAWGRITSIACAWLMIVEGMVFLFVPLPQIASQELSQVGPAALVAIKGAGFVWVVFYPIIVLWAFQKPEWKQTFSDSRSINI